MPRLKFLSDGLTANLVKRAEIELGETPEARVNALEIIKELIRDEPDFSPCMDDEFLIRFIRVRKYDMKEAFKLLKRYYIFKAQNWGVISGFKPSDFKDMVDEEYAYILEDRDDNDCAVAIIRFGLIDVNKYAPEQLLANSLNYFEISCIPEASNVAGLVVIQDFANFSFKQMMRFSKPSIISVWISMIQDCIPSRMKAVHVLNAPGYYYVLLKICKMFLSEKMKERIHIHKNGLESLYKCVPQEILPKEYGGTQGTWSEGVSKWAADFFTFDEYFEKLHKYGFKGKTLEKLRGKRRGVDSDI